MGVAERVCEQVGVDIAMVLTGVDTNYVKTPRRWETISIKSFIAYLGLLSSVFDVLCFAVLWWVVGANTQELAPLFQGGWFVFGTVSQVLVVHLIPTARIPFLQSRPATPLLVSTLPVTVLMVKRVYTARHGESL